jgi:O-antigen/teichoic acid export membrane protein
MKLSGVLTARQLRQLWYLPVLAVALALMMFRIMLMARLFDLPGFAEYSSGLLLSTTFCMFGCLGLQSLLQRDMPILLARRRRRAALVLMVHAMLVASACAGALVVPAALGAGFVQLSPGLAALAVLHGLSQQLFLVVTVESRSQGEPLRYAMQNLVRAVAVVAAGAAAARVTGSPTWVIAAEALVSLLIVAGTLRAIERSSGWPMAALWRLARRSWQHVAWDTAMVMLAISAVNFALLNLDRLAAASWLPPAAFAQFAFAGLVLLVAQSAQAMVNASVYPMLARRFALQGPAIAFGLCARVSLVALAGGLLLAWPAYHLGALVIRRGFVAYEPSISLIVLLLAAAVLRLSDFWSSFLMICGHERRLLRLNLLVCGVGVLAWCAIEVALGGFAPTAPAFCRLTLVLAATSHLAAAIAASLLRDYGVVPSLEGPSLHAQSQ